MPETKHSAEPWQVDDENDRIVDATGGTVADTTVVHPLDERRIVACVNACAGIPADALEDGLLDQALRALVLIYVQEGRSPKAKEFLRRLGRLP